jgi:arsenite methyltransferase
MVYYDSAADLRERVREHYAAAATTATGTASCCAGCGYGPIEVAEPGMAATFYTDAERRQLPAATVAASLGCGNPLAVADLRGGEIVLDHGSGGGIDVLLSARRVGPTGRAYGWTE